MSAASILASANNVNQAKAFHDKKQFWQMKPYSLENFVRAFRWPFKQGEGGGLNLRGLFADKK